MILADSEVASLKAAIRWWESFGYASTAVVGLGCIEEFVAEFTAISKDENRKHKLSRLSLIILIFGIAGELLSAVRTSNLSGELIANIEERAAKAEQKAGEANDRAAANEKEAAQLRKYAEDERLRRTELEATLAWRRLTPKDNVLFPILTTSTTLRWESGTTPETARVLILHGNSHKWHTPTNGPFSPRPASLRLRREGTHSARFQGLRLV